MGVPSNGHFLFFLTRLIFPFVGTFIGVNQCLRLMDLKIREFLLIRIYHVLSLGGSLEKSVMKKILGMKTLNV